MTSDLTWISTHGGPLILLEKSLLPFWKGNADTTGIDGALERGELTDYDRACAIEDYLGTIPVGSGTALVLGDEPMQTSWFPLTRDTGILVRWEWAADETSVLKTLREVPEESWQPTGVTVEAKSEPLVLFDSAYLGDEIETSLSISLPSQLYSVDTAHWQPDDETSLILHRLQRREVNRITWGDTVSISPDAPVEFRPGAGGAVVGLPDSGVRGPAPDSETGKHSLLYLVEFSDGEAIEVPEAYLVK